MRLRLGAVALSVVLVATVIAGRWLAGALAVATGYSAKQLCSGVFVAGLPADFVIENDIHLSLATLGPLLPNLEVVVDREAGTARSSLFGAEAQAAYRGNEGCVLHPGLEGGGATASIAAAEASRPRDIDPDLAPVLEEAFAEPGQGQRRTLAILVSHHGRLVAERYAPPVQADTPLQGWSMNKSLMATWAGMQVEQGLLDLDAPISPRVAEIDPGLAQKLDSELNLGHLLHMESGLEFEETYFPGDDATRMLYRSPAMWRVAPGNGHRYLPGEYFSYSSGDTNLASWIWQGSLDRPYYQWIAQEFAEPLGLTGMTSEHDASGVQVGSSYTYMTASDWLRVGEFWLDAWHGRSPRLSADWMRSATTPREAATRGNYGRGFWLNTQGVDFPNLPRNLFYASGHNGQYVVMFPDRELVVVRLGLSSNGSATGLSTLLEGVLATLPLAPAPPRLEVARQPGR